MGQYYLGYVERGGKTKVFDNKVDNDWQGLKLMEHSWWLNSMVGNVVNDLFYNKARVCWVGDYYDEDNCSQVNCDSETVRSIGKRVWNGKPQSKCSRKKVRYLTNCLIVNHTKKVYIDCDEYYKRNQWNETWDGEEWIECIHPLPLLTCSGSHSGGSYHGINYDDCGTWFNDEIEVVLSWERHDLDENGYSKVEYEFRE